MKKEFIYIQIADLFEKKIHDHVFDVGDKLPSVRMICKEMGVSMSSAQAAYGQLEDRGLIYTKPKSGYYVSNRRQQNRSLTDISKPKATVKKAQQKEIINQIYDTLNQDQIIQFAIGIPAPELLPTAKLKKSILKSVRELEHGGVRYESIEGNQNLRRAIAKRSFNYKVNINENDIITTAGCNNALVYALMALTKRNDIIAVESPVYYGVVQLCQSLGLKIIEIPTHPQSGMDIQALNKATQKHKITACVVISNFNNPLGYAMSSEHKQKLVQLITKKNIPLIEDDIYGDIHFGTQRPDTCKSYDTKDMVLYCSSFSKTLTPGYRVGWVVPGKYKEQILKIKSLHVISNTSITHQAVADFLMTHKYEKHLRTYRNTLHNNCMKFQKVIQDQFPDDVKISQPRGGLFLWIELNKKIDSLDIYNRAMQHNIAIAPGQLFTMHQQFGNCIRLNFAQQWDNKIEKSLQVLGDIVGERYGSFT